MDNKENDKRLIIAISFDENKGTYEVKLPAGSNLAEAAFGISAFIKCLVRDKVIKTPTDFIEQIRKYTFDVQYKELEDGDDKS